MHTWVRVSGRLIKIELIDIPITYIANFPIFLDMANPPERTLNELFAPASATPPTCIVLPEVAAEQLKLGLQLSICYPNSMVLRVSNPIFT